MGSKGHMELEYEHLTTDHDTQENQGLNVQGIKKKQDTPWEHTQGQLIIK